MKAWLAALQRAPAATICPLPCGELEALGQGWAVYPDQASLAACNETMLVDFVFQEMADDGLNNKLALSACVADFSAQDVVFRANADIAALCPTPNHAMIERTVALVSSVPGARAQDSFSTEHLLAAGRQVLHQLESEKPSCTRNAISMAYSQSSLIGVFGGPEVHQHGLTAEILDKFLVHAQETSLSMTTLVQLCEGDGLGSDYGVGIIAGSTRNFPVVQKAIRSWTDGRCYTDAAGDGNANDWTTVTIRVPNKANSTKFVTREDDTSPAHLFSRGGLASLDRRADCRTTKVQSGDGCWALADRCKITQDNLKKYNPRNKFCDTLVVGELVCCSAGTLPSTIPPGNSDGTCKIRRVVKDDTCTTLASKCGLSGNDFMKVNAKKDLCSTLIVGQPVCCSQGKLPYNPPKQKANGFCADYEVKTGDECARIAVMNDITVADLKAFNKQTWGWIGCDPLYTGKICLSTGSPPMPASVSNAVCGPTVPGTAQPAAGKNVSTLNPCPLNACCNNWGNCGLTADFCKVNKAASGNPGTAPPGQSGCIDNCGMSIIKGAAPAKKINVAYFEAWNFKRKCLNMDVDMIDTKRYNTIHFAFIDITNDFKMDISKVKDQFALFKAMTGVRKVVSFGGWDFSNSPGTFHILREATKSNNRATFVKNILAFVKDHGIDGVDLDWEYPGAPDIPDIPPGNPQEGDDYYQTLQSLKTQIGSGKTVSFAAPASFHYLKSFPMKKMGDVLDYIIYMTYDLHGQWDYGNKWTSPGCPNGNCLRSHVNETETKDALAMITKAGVPSGKIVVGVASYGRSFKMATAGCDGVNCAFTGSNRASNAKKGRCTDTAGYISNAEIAEILDSNRVTRKWKAEGSNMLVYDKTEWVAYMDEDTRKTRTAFYDSYNFAGTTDWAVDLQEFHQGVGGGTGMNNDDHPTVRNRFSKCTRVFTSFGELKNVADEVPDHCMNRYIFALEIRTIEAALKKFKALVDGGYDKKFNVYADYVKEQVPAQIDAFMSKRGNDYFDCKNWAKHTCCGDCNYATCLETCIRASGCKTGYFFRDITCPSTFWESTEPGVGSSVPNTTWVMKDKDKFFKDIYQEHGIEKGWIDFATIRVNTPHGCQFDKEGIQTCIDKTAKKFFNFPVAGKVSVFNPKDIIGKGYPEALDLLRRLKIMLANIEYDFGLSARDLVDSSSLPAFSMEEAVNNMDKIVEKAGEIEEARRKEFILNFISGLLFWIPFVGGAVGGAGMGTLRSMLSLIGTVGEAGLLVYGIVEDPDSALMAVFGFLAGAGVGRGGYRNAAEARRSMTSKEISSLGPIKGKLEMISSLQGQRCSI
ncbi:putative glycosyl hydrolase, family 18 [Stachybotrys elegans]|uniref:chitinase n=1 Tax=Stachybotrys elegans TaxID=80388 RepID=A0A8K0SUA0_9HYPO|nr:putative glycosyl hydrolase, family 18 [Stachybotrys elegans]